MVFSFDLQIRDFPSLLTTVYNKYCVFSGRRRRGPGRALGLARVVVVQRRGEAATAWRGGRRARLSWTWAVGGATWTTILRTTSPFETFSAGPSNEAAAPPPPPPTSLQTLPAFFLQTRATLKLAMTLIIVLQLSTRIKLPKNPYFSCWCNSVEFQKEVSIVWKWGNYIVCEWVWWYKYEIRKRIRKSQGRHQMDINRDKTFWNLSRKKMHSEDAEIQEIINT